jgi:hypothetical protein
MDIDAVNHQYQMKNNNNDNNNNNKLSKVLSTKLSIEDYNAFVILTKLEYEAGLIKEQSTSELLRFTIHHILKQVHNQPEYLILKQQQQQQNKAQNNQQQQIHHQYGLLPTITTATHQDQVPNIPRRNNSVAQKMTPWKLSSLLSTQRNNHT